MANPIFAAVVDIETTGLSASENIPLEFGIKLIDKEGYVFDEHSWLIYENTMEWRIEMGRGARDKFVGPMHEKSGLWDDLIGKRNLGTTWTREELDTELVLFLEENEVIPGSIPMMGNSIGSLDRPFCLIHFPKFNEAISYRNVDISSVKLLCEANNPGLYANLKSILGGKENAKHRVLDDIDACITEYRAYRENFFFLEDE